MNHVEIAALDELDLLVVVDNESDTLSSVDKGVPQLPELGRLVARVPHLAPKDGHDCVEPLGNLCLACHGFSALVTGRRGSEERSILFDVGPSAEVWLENARRLGVRLASIEAVCLSHWRADHSEGRPGVWLPSLGPASTKRSRSRSSIYIRINASTSLPHEPNALMASTVIRRSPPFPTPLIAKIYIRCPTSAQSCAHSRILGP